MSRNLSVVIAVTASLLLPATAFAAPAGGKRHVKVQRHWHGYGFLPGYRTPAQIEREQARKWRPYYYWYGRPGFYQGRWSGGRFGPCWTQTPIGPHWNC